MANDNEIDSDKSRLLALIESFFKKTGDALVSGDFDSFAECFAIPHKMESFAGTIYVNSREDLEKLFFDVCHQLQRIGTEKIERRCLEVLEKTPEELLVTHESRYLIGDQLLQEPVIAYSRVVLEDGVWKIADGMYAFDKDSQLSNIFDKLD